MDWQILGVIVLFYLIGAVAAWILREEPLTRDLGSTKYYFSLSTVPGRQASLRKTLDHLMAQEPPPTGIVVNMPYFSKRFQRSYCPGDYLRKAPYRDIVLLNRTEDHGPATKVIPTIEMLAADARILVVDDDTSFPPNLAASFLRWEKKYPDCALGATGFKYDTSTPEIGIRIMRSDDIIRPVRMDVMEGFRGYLVKPRFFDVTKLKDYTGAPAGAFFEDDQWISGQLARNQVCRLLIPGVPMYDPRTTDDILGTALSGKENKDKQNRGEMAQYFRDDW